METNKAKITKTYITANGTLYIDSIVRIYSTVNQAPLGQVRVKDDVGRIFFIKPQDMVII